jgi:hypothetical protein
VSAELPLDRLQRWMQAVVVHPGTVGEGLACPDAEREVAPGRVGEVVLPSRTLAPEERVEIYHGMYLMRMTEALASDYYALEHFLGDHGFRELVRGYVQLHPSRSFTLNRLGDRLPAYLREAPGIPRREFCHELAALELAVSQVFDAAETPSLSQEAIAAVPAEAWATARLEPVTAFRLLSFRYPVNEYLQSVREDDHRHPRIRRKDSWVAIYRRNYSVYRQDLTRAAYDLLGDLVAGTPLGDAVASALRKGGRRGVRQEELFDWFRQWTAGGVFRSVRTA